MAKDNFKLLIEILKDHPEKVSINKALGEIRKDMQKMKDVIEEEEYPEPEGLNDENIGIGTIAWRGDNLILQDRMQTVMNNLKVEFGMLPA